MFAIDVIANGTHRVREPSFIGLGHSIKYLRRDLVFYGRRGFIGLEASLRRLVSQPLQRLRENG